MEITQFEFDNMMNAIKREYEEQAKPLRKQLEALNEEYIARKEALKKAFPNVKGVLKPDGVKAREAMKNGKVIIIQV